MSFVAHTAVIGDGPKTAFVLHGILGAGRNWRSFSRRLAAARPDLRLVLIDQRNHGDSPAANAPHTLDACADDLERLGRAEFVIGHSFGGKVALTLARRRPAGLSQAVVLDAWPGIGSDGTTLSVIAALKTVEVPAPSRDAVRKQLSQQGLGPELVTWLLTSMRRTDIGWVWKYNLNGVDAMISDYLQTDLWPWLESRDGGPRIDIVRAEKNERWTPEALDRLDAISPTSDVHSHVVSNAGHWLHVDNPDGLLAILSGALRSD